MKTDESILVLVSLVFGVVLFFATFLNKSRVGVLDSFLSNDAHIDKTKLPALIKFLLIVALMSIPFGYIFTRRFSLVLQFVGLNLFFGVIMGTNLLLVRKRDKHQSK